MVKLVEPLTVRRIAEDSQELGGMKAHLGITFQITKVTRTPIVNADGSTGFEVKETTDIISRWGLMTPLLVGASDETLAGFVSSSSAEIIEEVEKFTQGGSGHGIDFIISSWIGAGGLLP